MTDLKLIAFDVDDLNVLSAHLQDAVLRVEDLTYIRSEKRFALVANRFDWAGAHGSGASEFVRKRTGVRFERVRGAQVSGIDLQAKQQCLELLAIGFSRNPEDDPSGFVTLTFAGGGGIRLSVECIEAELKDLGAAWRTGRKPSHGGAGEEKT